MKVLWVNINFLHPSNKGGVIRTLEMLRCLRHRHEIHYAAIEDPRHPEGPQLASEYSHRAYPFQHHLVDKTSPAFYGQLVAGLFSPLPIAVKRFHLPALGEELSALLSRERFDRAVVDHLAPASFYPDLAHSLLFQHNVESVIWQRHAQEASGVRKLYFRLQAGKMFTFERQVCQTAGHIVAVSPDDARWMREYFGVSRVSEITTGVNVQHYTPNGSAAPVADLVFIGSMDWLANVDAITYFVEEILPLVRRKRPGCSLAVVGRNPAPAIRDLARNDPRIIVTGTVSDVRPYLWGSSVSIVPLRIGGGTRLKIYESMAARLPVVSTTIGAEGLETVPGENICIGDTPQAFADHCIELLEDSAARSRLADAGWAMVRSHFSWEKAAEQFEKALLQAPGPR